MALGADGLRQVASVLGFFARCLGRRDGFSDELRRHLEFAGGEADGPERFVAEYVRTSSGTEAAAIVWPNMSRASHAQYASRLIKIPAIAKEIRAAKARIAKEAELEAVDIIRGLKRIAFADVRTLFDPENRLLSPSELSDGTAAAIASIKAQCQGGIVEIRFADRIGALDLLAKMFGLYKKDNSQRADPLDEVLAMIDGKTANLTENPRAE